MYAHREDVKQPMCNRLTCIAAGESIGMDVKTLFGEESTGKIKELLNTGRDVLIREYEKDGVCYICSRPATIWRCRERGYLYVQCYDQEETFQTDPRKRLRGLRWDQLIGS